MNDGLLQNDGLLTSADVETNVETLRLALNGGVVGVDVGVEESIRVDAICAKSLKHVLGAEVGHGGVIDLDALQTFSVESLELLLVSLGEVGEELLVGGIGLLGIALSVGQSQMEVWCRGLSLD